MKNNNLFLRKNAIACSLILLFFCNFLCVPYSVGKSELYDSSTESIRKNNTFNPYTGDNCTKIGEYDSNYGSPSVCRVFEHKSRTIAFMVESRGLLILDVTIPENPILLKFLLEFTYISDVCLIGDFLYVTSSYKGTSSNEGLLIYYIANILEPVLLYTSEFDVYYSLKWITSQDDFLYIYDLGRGIVVFNVTNRVDPQFVSRYHVGLYDSYFYDFVVEGNFAYISHRNSFRIVNLTDIHDPTLVSVLYSDDYYDYFRYIEIQADRAYVCADNGAIHILDISNKTNPTKIGFAWDESMNFFDLCIEGTKCYLLERNSGIVALNVSNPQRITCLYKGSEEGIYNTISYHQGYFYICNQIAGLEIYKVLQDNAIEFVTKFIDGGFSKAVKVSGKHAFVANGYCGLEIYKLQRTFNPILKHRINLGIYCSDVFLNNDLVYLYSYMTDSLAIVDISPMRNPQIIGFQSLILEIENNTVDPDYFEIYGSTAIGYYRSYPRNYLVFLDLTNTTAFEIKEIMIFEDTYIHHFLYTNELLFLVTNQNELLIYSQIEDSWELISTSEFDYYVRDMYLYGDFLFIGTHNDLTIYDIHNLDNPVERTVFSGLENEYLGYIKVIVESNIAYLIGEYNKELYFINVEDIDNPYLEAFFVCNESLTDLYVANNKVYLSAGFINLQVIQLDRFISLLNFAIYSPLLIMAAIIGFPIIIVTLIRARRKRIERRIKITDILPREKLKDSRQAVEADSSVELSPEDYDDPKLYALAKKILEAVEKDTK